MTKTLWTKEQERDFFLKSLERARPEKLFYRSPDGRFYAYWSKAYKGPRTTLQSRNYFIGDYTDKWCADLLEEIAEEVGGYAVKGVACEEIGLTRKSPADVAICRTSQIIQVPENLLLIVEVKMSVVWIWELRGERRGEWNLVPIGDYSTHRGTPSLLRSDTMLKAIGKGINIRVSSLRASKIPIIIIGNTPITKAYHAKVDNLKNLGIIQGFWSLNPSPLDGGRNTIKSTPQEGFHRLDSLAELRDVALKLLGEEDEFFSGMKTLDELGRIVQMANREETYEKKAQKFLELIRSGAGTQ